MPSSSSKIQQSSDYLVSQLTVELEELGSQLLAQIPESMRRMKVRDVWNLEELSKKSYGKPLIDNNAVGGDTRKTSRSSKQKSQPSTAPTKKQEKNNTTKMMKREKSAHVDGQQHQV